MNENPAIIALSKLEQALLTAIGVIAKSCSAEELAILNRATDGQINQKTVSSWVYQIGKYSSVAKDARHLIEDELKAEQAK